MHPLHPCQYAFQVLVLILPILNIPANKIFSASFAFLRNHRPFAMLTQDAKKSWKGNLKIFLPQIYTENTDLNQGLSFFLV